MIPARFAHPRGRLFLACWGGALLLFWVIVLGNLSASQRAPRLMAATRFNFDSKPEARMTLWRYTGERPAEAQRLRVYYRQGSNYPHADGVQLVGYFGNETRPDPARLFFESEEEPAADFFQVQFEDLPPWPEGETIWLGLRHKASARLWIEQGEGPWGGLSPRAASVTGKNFVRMDRDPYFSSIYTTIVKKDATVPRAAAPVLQWGVYILCLLVPPFILRGFRRWWMAFAIFQAVLFWKAMEVLFPSQYLWGGYYFIRIGGGVFWGGLLLFHVVTFPALWEHVSRFFTRGWCCMRRRWRGYFSWPLLVVGAAVFYMIASSFWSKGLYGDAYGSLANPGYDYHNPLATAAYHLWRDIYLAWYHAKGEKPLILYADYNLISIFVALWSPVYFFFSGVLARQLGRTMREAFMVFLCLLLIKPALTLFGYVEVYGPALAVQVSLLSMLIAGYRRGRVVFPSAFSFLGYLFQMGGAMALPAIAVLWASVFWRTERRPLWLVTRLLATAGLALLVWANCLGLLFIFKHNENPDSFKQHVPALHVEIDGRQEKLYGVAMLVGSTGREKKEVFFQTKEMHYSHHYLLTSWKHASQVTAEIFFIAGPVFPLFVFSFFFSRRWGWRSPERLGVGLAGIAFFVSAVLLATSYPYPKDWDVFSVHTLWWLTGLFLCLTRGGALPPAARRWLIAALVLFFLWDTMPWLWYNLTWGPPAQDRAFVYY